MPGRSAIAIGLNAVIVAMRGGAPHVLTTGGERGAASLPFGLFDPERHRTMEKGLRALVAEQTARDLGYIEQLYTFGDRGRQDSPRAAARGGDVVSVGYLTLTREESGGGAADQAARRWRGWYGFLPWEDRRRDLHRDLLGRLRGWAEGDRRRRARLRLCFGLPPLRWDEEKVLERYELLYEAGLVAESGRRGGRAGQAMPYDHRRILATAVGRLRGKLKYRPVIFELMPRLFTLYELQQAVEAIAGIHLHKQNFRRLVERENLVEASGPLSRRTGGRPAAQFRFRKEVLDERGGPGLNLKTGGAARGAGRGGERAASG